MAVLTPGQIAKQFTAHYQPIVDLNTGAVAGFEALARVVKSDGAITTVGAVIDKIERRTDTLQALIRTILSSIRRDIVPLFEQHPSGHLGQRPHSADRRRAGTYAVSR